MKIHEVIGDYRVLKPLVSCKNTNCSGSKWEINNSLYVYVFCLKCHILMQESVYFKSSFKLCYFILFVTVDIYLSSQCIDLQC